jgi:hypothetical protein
MKRLSITAVSLLGAALVVGAAPPADAQLYRWTNEQGELHITEGLDSVPERFRKGAVLLGHPPARVPTPSGPPPGLAGPASTQPTAPRPTPPPLPLAAPGPEGQLLARIPYVAGSPIVVNARVNGGRSVQLILDTGAEVTMISPQALSALGVEMRPVRAARIQGVAGTGTLDVPSIMLDSVEVGEAKAGPLEVLAHNPSLTRGEGLLGRDFLDRFTVSIDSRAREVRLGRR